MAERNIGFFHQPPRNCFCSGAKSECADLAESDDYRIIDWNADASDLPVRDVKLLHLVPGRQQLKKGALPAFVPDLKHLENIIFNPAFLRHPHKNRLPASLRSITLARDLQHEAILEELLKSPVAWSEEVSLKKLEAMRVIGGREKTTIVKSFSANVFPSLRFLSFDISEKSELDVFSRFSALSDVELHHLKDLEVFGYIEHLPLVSLDLGGTNNTFDLSAVKRLKTLRFLRLNGLRSEIDCEIFRELPELKELIVLNSKKVKNIEALLECRNLSSIDFLDCGNPFKGVAATFERGNYERLDIKYA